MKHRKTMATTTKKITASNSVHNNKRVCSKQEVNMTRSIDTVINKGKRNRKDILSAFKTYIPLVGGGSGFLNSGFLGVSRVTFSSGTVLAVTSGALKIFNFHFCEY